MEAILKATAHRPAEMELPCFCPGTRTLLKGLGILIIKIMEGRPIPTGRFCHPSKQTMHLVRYRLYLIRPDHGRLVRTNTQAPLLPFQDKAMLHLFLQTVDLQQVTL